MERQYVAIDLHRRRSLIVRENEAGEELGVVRIDNDPVTLAAALAEAGPEPEVAIEATYGWYWAVDVLRDMGANVHLVNPSGLAWEDRRVKNDYLGLPGAVDPVAAQQVARGMDRSARGARPAGAGPLPGEVVALRTGCKAQVKAVLANHGLHPPVAELWGPVGGRYLDEVCLEAASTVRVESLRDLVEVFDREVAMVERELRRRLVDHDGYHAIQEIPGMGPVMAAIFVAEIGDIGRFATPAQLCSWAGLTPKHRESDTKARRGKITKQGSKLVRWAAVEAVAHIRGPAKLQGDYRRIAERRGTKGARIAAARKLLTLVFYGLRDGEIRCPAQAEEAA